MADECPSVDRETRARVLKFGYVRYGPHRHKVLLCDISADGAHLRTEYVGEIGDWLELTINGKRYRAQIRWIRELHMGVQFEGAVNAINQPPRELEELIANFRDIHH